jgi:predicted metal-binding protein
MSRLRPTRTLAELLSGDREPTAAKAPWDDLLLVCRECLKRQGRDASIKGEALDDWLERQLKKGALEDVGRLQVAKCACLDLCPKRGVTLALGSEMGGDKPLHVFRNADDPQRLIAWIGSRAGRKT